MKRFSVLFKYIKSRKLSILILLVLFILASLISIPVPIIQKHIIDESIPEKNKEQLLVLVASIMCLMSLNFGFGYFKDKLNIKVRQKIITDLRVDIYDRLQKMDLIFFKKNQSGFLLSRVLNDAGIIRNLVTDQLLSLVVSAIKVVIIIAILFQMNAKLTLLCLSVLPPIIIIFIKYRSIIYKNSKELQESYALASGKIRENIAAISMIQAENAEGQKKQETLKYCKNLEDITVNREITGTKSFILTSILSNIPLAGIIWGIGGYMTIMGSFSLGSLIAYYQYIFAVMGPVSTFFKFGMNIQSGLAAIDRISEILNVTSPVEDKKHAKQLLCPIKKIEFLNVNLVVPDRNDPAKTNTILKNISFAINQGESVGLVGPNGSGKTTITRLLLRQLDFQNGSIYLNNEDIRNYRIKDIRNKIAYVSQESFFFHDTLRNNLTLGRDISDREIYTVLHSTNTLDLVESLENGLNTIISEQGSSLSGGERQVFSLIRVFIRKPEIYIFDEPFLSMDTKSEQLIRRSIAGIIQNATAIIISHKKSINQLVNRIIELKNSTTADSSVTDIY